MLPIIGMSPGNSYFKDKEVAYLLRETLRKYWKAVIMIADVPSVSTYLAMWYTPTKAARKARLQWNALKNRTVRVLEEMGIDTTMVTIINRWEEVEPSRVYIQSLIDIKKLYDENPVFHDEVFRTSKEVLVWAKKEITAESVEQATEYLLAELAFIYASPILLNTDQIYYVYHKPWKVYEQRIAGKYDGTPKPELNFVLLEHPTETVYATHTKSIVFADRWEVIQKRGSVRAVLFPYLDQVWYDTEEKKWKGWCVEMFRAFFREQQINLEILGEVWYGVVSTVLDRGDADIFISPIWPYDERKLEVFHTQPHAKADIYALLPIHSPYKSLTFGQIARQYYLRVAVKENDVHHFLAKELFPNAKYVMVPQLAPIESIVHKVLNDEADITFWDPSLIDYISDLPAKDTLITKSLVRNSPVISTDVCFAVPWWEFTLKKVVDEWITKHLDRYLPK